MMGQPPLRGPVASSAVCMTAASGLPACVPRCPALAACCCACHVVTSTATAAGCWWCGLVERHPPCTYGSACMPAGLPGCQCMVERIPRVQSACSQPRLSAGGRCKGDGKFTYCTWHELASHGAESSVDSSRLPPSRPSSPCAVDPTTHPRGVRLSRPCCRLVVVYSSGGGKRCTFSVKVASVLSIHRARHDPVNNAQQPMHCPVMPRVHGFCALPLFPRSLLIKKGWPFAVTTLAVHCGAARTMCKCLQRKRRHAAGIRT